MQIHQGCNIIRAMDSSNIEFLEKMCRRFMQAQEVTGLSKKDFGERVGLSSQQMSNIASYRNPPSHDTIRRVVTEFGFATDWFYFGSRVGFRDPVLAERLRVLA